MNNYEPVIVYPLKDDDGWKELAGELPVKMTNDYLFRALLQSDNATLKALLASLLQVDVQEIKTAEVSNPILLGKSVDDKMFIMDVKVVMNDDALIDLEMQVVREYGWNDRSLSYICRAFDQLNKGGAYHEAKPVRQISFCDFTLFEEVPEFYATYKLLNIRDKKTVYSDKFSISYIDLTRPDLATAKDKKYRLDEWCRLFKAKTWEDMKMLAENNQTMGKAVSGVWQLTEEELIREQCRAREEWIINDKWVRDRLSETEAKLAEKDDEIAKKDDEIAKKGNEIAKKDRELKAALAEKDAVIEEYEAQIKNLKAKLASAGSSD